MQTPFEHTSAFRLHWWLQLLDCNRLSRIDLAVDDFHGLFGRDYAKKPTQMMPSELRIKVVALVLANVTSLRLPAKLSMNHSR